MRVMEEKQEKKCKRQPGVFNFSSESLTETQENILAKGRNYVMHLSDSPKETWRRVRSEITLYLEKYSEKFKLPVNVKSLGKDISLEGMKIWLEKARQTTGIFTDHGEFFEKLSRKIEKDMEDSLTVATILSANKASF